MPLTAYNSFFTWKLSMWICANKYNTKTKTFFQKLYRFSSVSTSNYLKLHLNLIGLLMDSVLIRDVTAVYISFYLWLTGMLCQLGHDCLELASTSTDLSSWVESRRVGRHAFGLTLVHTHTHTHSVTLGLDAVSTVDTMGDQLVDAWSLSLVSLITMVNTHTHWFNSLTGPTLF